MKEEVLKVSQSTVAQALAEDYFCIYYVNIENDKFIEYSASPEYRSFGLPSIGDDFIAFSREKFDELIHPDDRERFLDRFTKENVVASLNKHSTFTMTFRMMFFDVPTYVHLKVTRMIEKEGHHAVIGISSVDEQMRAREAFERAHHSSITYSRIAQALAEDYFCIYYVDMTTDHFLEYSSEASYKKLGLAKSGEDFFEKSRRDCPRVMYEEDRGAFLAVFTKDNLQKVLDEHKTFTYSYRLLLGGVPTYVSMKATRMKDEDGNHIIIGINNIDAQMRQQDQYKRAEKDMITFSRVAQALAADFFSIYIVEPDTGHFVEYSATEDYEKLGIEKAGEDFFGQSRENMSRILYPDDHDRVMAVFTRERIMEILERDGSFTMKYRLMFEDSPVYVSMKATLLQDERGRHLVIGTNNIDAQMRREQKYQKKMAEARNRAKNDFLAHMSHDIRTPMNAIVGYTNIARANLENPEVIRNSLEKIGSSSHFLLSLINDVLDMSKIESGKMQLSPGRCDLAAIFRRIEDITSMQARNKSLQISYDHSGVRNYLVHGDELRIEQVLINIVSNAIKYTPEGKTVDLIAEEETLPDSAKSRYRFIIRDTGVGISEEYLPHIFESFSREESTLVNRVQGTGLGLAITAKVVELMGGTISVTSKVGEGSEFTVELDLEVKEEAADKEAGPAAGTAAVGSAAGSTAMGAAAGSTAVGSAAGAAEGTTVCSATCSAAGAATGSAAGTAAGSAEGSSAGSAEGMAVGPAAGTAAGKGSSGLSGLKILLMEDHDINAEIAILTLSQYGITVDRAENGRVGTDLLQERGPGAYDAVLMDIQMPVMNGYEATRAIRSLPDDYYQKLPIIAMSANAYEDDVLACLESGMNAHVAKPFNPDELYATLESHILRR